MKSLLVKNTLFGLKYQKWTIKEALLYFIKGASRELNITPAFWKNKYYKRTLEQQLISDGLLAVGIK